VALKLFKANLASDKGENEKFLGIKAIKLSSDLHYS
jgi:hypothetical protein